MTIKLLSTVLRKPADDSPDAGGGGFSFLNNNIEANDSESESGDSDNDTSGDDAYRSYHRLGPDGERPRSALAKAAEKALEGPDSKKEDSDKEEESKEDKRPSIKIGSEKEETSEDEGDKKEQEEKELSPEEEAKKLIDLDIDSIRTKNGKKISDTSGKVIAKFKKQLQNFYEENKKLKENPEVQQKIIQLTEERDALKKEIEEEHFEKSPAFKTAFIQPVVDASTKVGSYFKNLIKGEDDEEIATVRSLLEKSIGYAEAKDEDEFATIVDTIVEKHLSGGSARKQLFTASMMDLYKAASAKAEALTTKDETRKKVVSAKLEDLRRAHTVNIDRAINTHVEQFENSKKHILEGLKGKEREDYIDAYKGNVAKFKEGVTEFALTGKMTDEFTHIIQEGVTAGAIKKENVLLFSGYKDMKLIVDQKNSKIKELEAKIAKLSGEPDPKRKGGYVKAEQEKEDDNKSEYKSAIFAELQKIKKG